MYQMERRSAIKGFCMQRLEDQSDCVLMDEDQTVNAGIAK
jgi:hypothetical protein